MFSNWRRAKNFPAFKAEVQKPCGNLTALSETGRQKTTDTTTTRESYSRETCYKRCIGVMGF